MREPLTPMLFPLLGAHFSHASFNYPDNTSKEMCGMMANLVADSGCNKGQLTQIVNAVCRKFVAHDETEIEKLAKWQKAAKSRGATQDRPPRPDVALRFPPADMTNAAFIQNAVGCEKAGGYTQYFNLPEIEMADRICGGHRAFSHTLRNIYDRQRAGALRATADGVTGNPTLRVNLTISSTPVSTRTFYKNDLLNGTFGRMVFSYKPRTARDGRIPRQGIYDEAYLAELDTYLQRIAACNGRYTIKSLNALIDKLAREMAAVADLADDDILWDLSKRSLVSGGQKQRVAIARIFLKNPPILILDEATSALDSVTEAKIQRAFDTLSQGRTTLIIAHRLSTIRNASRIVSIADGVIKECGTHQELLEKGGIYSELYRTQNALALEAMQ